MKKAKPLTWCQEQILRKLPDDGQWIDIHPDPSDKEAIYHGPCAKGSVLRGLVSRGLIEHRAKDPDSPTAYLAWFTDGQIRKVSQAEDQGAQR